MVSRGGVEPLLIKRYRERVMTDAMPSTRDIKLAGRKGLEPLTTVLETAVLPITPTPYIHSAALLRLATGGIFFGVFRTPPTGAQ